MLEINFRRAAEMFKLGIEAVKIKNVTGLSDALLEKTQQGDSLTQKDLRRFVLKGRSHVS